MAQSIHDWLLIRANKGVVPAFDEGGVRTQAIEEPSANQPINDSPERSLFSPGHCPRLTRDEARGLIEGRGRTSNWPQ
jgi:hypothetical protein